MTDPYNPLDILNLGKSVGDAMLNGTPVKMSSLPRFEGAGVYAIYYTGGHPAYSLIAEMNRDGKFAMPIYVGKAIPEGARKGGTSKRPPHKSPLRRRLAEHAGSIRAAQNLDIEDFYCRWLVTEPIWIPLGESVMIGRFRPVWNNLLDGFGNHDPGSGRHKGVVSRWDVLHPGRSWVHKFAERPESAEDIAADVQERLRQRFQV